MSFVLQVFEYNPENPSWDLVSNATNFVKSKKKLGIYCDINPPKLGAVHILRQPPQGGGGVSQKLTIADKGGRHSEAILELFK